MIKLLLSIGNYDLSLYGIDNREAIFDYSKFMVLV